MPSVTVTGGNGVGYVVVNYDTAAYATLAQSLLAGRDGQLINTSGLSTINDGTGAVVGVGTQSNLTGLGAVTLVDNNTVTDQLILSGNGTDMTFSAAAGGGTVLGGDGTSTYDFGSGDWQLNLSGTTNASDMTTMTAGSGFDVFAGGAGDSTVTAGSGTLFAFGGTGTVSYDLTAGGPAYLVGGPGTASVTGGAGMTTVAGSTGSAVYFTGSSDSNLFIAGDGPETLSAAGATGANTFFAGTGADSMSGGTGNDILFGGTGSSTLTGGGGTDAFAFVNQAEGSTSSDTVTDWTSADALELIGGVTVSDQSTTSGELVITLSDDTSITFTGVTSDIPDSQIFSFG